MKSHINNPLKTKLLMLVIIQSLLFMATAVIIFRRGFSESAERIDGTVSEIEKAMPILSNNENEMSTLYMDMLYERLDYLAEELSNGHISGKDDLSHAADMFDLDGIYVTDKSGKILLSYGLDPPIDLPFTDVFYDNQNFFLAGKQLEDGSYLSVSFSTENFLNVIEDTLSSYMQLLGIGLSCNTDIYIISNKLVVSTYDEPRLLGVVTRKTPYNDFILTTIINDILHPVMGKELSFNGYTVLVGSQFADILSASLALTMQLLFFELLIVIFLSKFIYYCVKDSNFNEREYRQSTLFGMGVGLAILFMISWFWLSLAETAQSYSNLEDLLLNNNLAQIQYTNEYKMLNNWMDSQYLMQCRIAGEYVSHKSDDLSREYLDELADNLGVEYIFVIDKNGNVSSTNSPYDHFAISSDPSSQSGALRPLLNGVDHIIQPQMNDDVSGESRQYIGVSIRDENNLSNGCVLITIASKQKESLNKHVSYSQTLPYILIGSAQAAHLVNSETGEIIFTTVSDEKGLYIDDLSIPHELIDSSTLSVSDDEGRLITGSSDIGGDRILVISTLLSDSGQLAVNALQIICFAGVVMSIACLLGYLEGKKKKEHLAFKTPEEQSKPESSMGPLEDQMTEDDRGFFVFTNLLKNNSKYRFESRWEKKKKNPEDMTPLEMAYSVDIFIAGAFCILFLLPVVLSYLGISSALSDTLVYVISGRHNNDINIFSVAQCLVLITVMVLINKVSNWLLYHVAKLGNSRVETVCLLLRGSLKYICSVVVIFYILSLLGINASTLLASAGVLTVVIGFGAKDITADLLSGFFIIFERTFDVGDFVTIGNKYGTVTEIGLRTTKISFFGDTAIINNSDIRGVINQSGEFHRITIDLDIPADTDLLEFERLIEAALPSMQDKITGLLRPPKYRGVSALSGKATTVNFAVYMEGWRRYSVQREFLRQLRLFLDENNLRIPRDQIDIHNIKDELITKEEMEQETLIDN